MVEETQSRRPLLLLAAAIAVGAAAGPELGRLAAIQLALLGAVGLALAVKAARGWGAAGVTAAALAIGASASSAATEHYAAAPLTRWLSDPAHIAAPVRVEGRLKDEPVYSNQRWRLDLDLSRAGPLRADWVGRSLISIGGEAGLPEATAQSRVALWARLRPPRPASNPGGYDSAGRARRLGIQAFGTTKSGLLVAALGPAESEQQWMTRARRAARRILTDATPAGEARGLVLALVTGDRSGVDDSIGEALRLSGIFHLLAISGAHVAVVAGLLLWLTTLFRAGPGAAAVIVVVGLVAYAAFVGGAVPVRRAALMAIVIVLGRALELDADVANLLGLAALCLLAVDPLAIGSISFQLSFAATLGIALVTPVLLRLLPRLPLRVDVALAASVAAQLSLLPLLLFHFNRLAPAGLVVNVVAAPLAATSMVAGFGCVATATVGAPGAELMAAVAWLAADLLISFAKVFAQVRWLDVRLPDPTLTAVLAYYAGVALLIRGPRRALGLGLLLASLVSVAWVRRPAADGRLHVTALDVGQGDAIVVQSPRAGIAVIDAGPASRTFDAGERVVAPYLWARGIRRIDLLVLTHPHGDHVGGAGFLLEHFDVGEVWEGYAVPTNAVYRRVDRAAAGSRATRLGVARGVRRVWDGVSIEVESPGPRPGPPASVKNDDSLVLRLVWGAAAVLLPGDIGSRIEAQLDPGQVTLLKLPHHGSRTSSSQRFVRATAPRLVVASVGSRNPFSHPHPDVVRRYDAVGARVLRTDRDGAVTVSTDGERVWLSTMLERRPRPVS